MSDQQRSLALRPGEGRSISIGASSVRFLALGADTGDRSSVEEIGVPPRFEGPPAHFHNQTNHGWYVVEGRLILTLDTERHDLAEGGFVYVPTGTPHTFANPFDDLARMVQFTVPGGFERYLEELAAAFPQGTTIDRAGIIEIMARYDTYPA